MIIFILETLSVLGRNYWMPNVYFRSRGPTENHCNTHKCTCCLVHAIMKWRSQCLYCNPFHLTQLLFAISSIFSINWVCQNSFWKLSGHLLKCTNCMYGYTETYQIGALFVPTWFIWIALDINKLPYQMPLCPICKLVVRHIELWASVLLRWPSWMFTKPWPHNNIKMVNVTASFLINRLKKWKSWQEYVYLQKYP